MEIIWKYTISSSTTFRKLVNIVIAVTDFKFVGDSRAGSKWLDQKSRSFPDSDKLLAILVNNGWSPGDEWV